MRALLLAMLVACGGDGGDSADMSRKACSNFLARCQRPDCSECLAQHCCKEVTACNADQSCLGCFDSGNYTSCGPAADPLVICSADNCDACNGCYGPP
jgi:hypothetical protein